MKSLVDMIKDIIEKQQETELQQTEILVNQEYQSCLLELQEQEE